MALKKQTVVVFRDYLSSLTLREIKSVFDSEDIPLREGYIRPHSGQRRSLVDAYMEAIDFSKPESIIKLTYAIEFVLVNLTAVIEDCPNSAAAADAESSRNHLLRWLKRDGFNFQNGRLTAIEASDSSGTTEAPSQLKPPVPEADATRSVLTTSAPKVFISYSWDGSEHQDWVKNLAAKLRSHGVDATFDRWALAPGDQLTQFMERAVRENEHVLVVCTRKYKEKSDARIGGVGYEGDIMTGEVINGQNARKFVPILKEGEWKNVAPSWLASRFYLDFRGTPYSEETYEELLNNLFGTREQAPPLGMRPLTRRGATISGRGTFTPPQDEAGPIKIKGIVLDDIGTPRNDGSPGSALYKVPFQLSRRPSDEWARHFVQTWDHPPSYTTMHRPGIARIVGDRIILDGTTVPEVEKYHRDTLKVVIEKVNMDVEEHETKKRRMEEQRAQKLREHEQSAKDMARRITFD